MNDSKGSMFSQLSGDELNMPWIRNAGFQSFDHGYLLDWHHHSGGELTFAVKGYATWEIEGEESITVNSTDGSYVAPGVIHRALNGVNLPHQCIWIVLNNDCDCPSENTPFTDEEVRQIQKRFESLRVRSFKINEGLAQLLLQFREKMMRTNRDDPNYYMYWRVFLAQVLLESYESLTASSDQKEGSEIEQLEAYIETNLSEDISVFELAELIHKSETYVYNLFRIALGHSPNDYIQSKRIEKAIDLLDHSQESITTIAFNVGFSSSQYFSKIFSKYVGCSPSRYRKDTEQIYHREPYKNNI